MNSKPYESVISRTSFEVCSLGGNNPTCGWYVDDNGVRVPASTGFCCSCKNGGCFVFFWFVFSWLFLKACATSKGTLEQVVSGDTSLNTRAGGSCGISSLFGSSTFTTAHCLRFDDLWYDVYGIGSAEASFNIGVRLTTVNATNNATIIEDVILGPDVLLGASESGFLEAVLVGDFASFKSFPVLSLSYLFIPARPINHPLVQQGNAAYILLPRDQVDLTGTVPNKVGVSFAGFRNQPQACLGNVGDGLLFQLADYQALDEAKRAKGLPTDYWVSSYGKFSMLQGQSASSRYLAFEMPAPPLSVVTLTFSADNLKLITNNSPGKINSAYVEPFEAQSKAGIMNVMVSNIGQIESEYTVAVISCSPNIMDVLGQQVNIKPFRSTWLEFAIRAQTELGGLNQCTVNLLDSLGKLLESIVVPFNTTDTQKTQGAQAGIGPNVTGTNVTSGSSPHLGEICDGCSLFDVSCSLGGACVGNLLKGAAAVLLPIGGILLLIKLCMSPGFRRFICGARVLSSRGAVEEDAPPPPRRVRRPRNTSPGSLLQPTPAPTSLLSSLPLKNVYFNVIRPDAPMSIPGRLVAGTEADGGAPLVFEADPSSSMAKTHMARTPLTVPQANMFISKRALY